MLLIGVIVLFRLADAVYEGDECIKNGINGVCRNLRNCQPAIDDIKRRINPQICAFSGADPIVCCVNANEPPPITSPKPVATTSTRRTPSTTEYIPPVYVYETGEDQGSCEPLSPKLTSPKTGQKAWDKCIEYQEQLIYPCVRGAALTGELARADSCGHAADQLVVGGENAAVGEFPHMALLGFGDTAETAQWLCGGTLLSDKFIMTAGHCTSSRDFGQLTYAKLGSLKRSDSLGAAKVHRIRRIIKHPEYKPPSKYNDIALLEVEGVIILDQFTVPACLHVGDVKEDRAIATGWGTTEYRGENADIMQKVTLTKFSGAECSEKFPVTRLMNQGVRNTQMCYGDHSKSKDTCQGDSGGPLQIKSSSIHCMYVVVGVTSFGKACGYIGDPGIYTRVKPYVPWIEGIVWA